MKGYNLSKEIEKSGETFNFPLNFQTFSSDFQSFQNQTSFFFSFLYENNALFQNIVKLYTTYWKMETFWHPNVND